MRIRIASLFFILIGFCLGLISCAGKTVTELRAAREAIQAAKSAGAERYAPKTLTEAQASYNEADEGAATREDLRELYIRAAIQARIAEVETKMREAEETLRQVQADYAKAKEATAAAKNSVEEARAASPTVPAPKIITFAGGCPAIPPNKIPLPYSLLRYLAAVRIA